MPTEAGTPPQRPLPCSVPAQKDGTATENEMESKTWTGGEWSKRSTDSNRGGEYRLDHSSQIGRERGTLTRLVEGLVEATFKPKDADSRTFGGEGTSHRNEMKADLKYMDPRIVPFLHEELSSDMLRTVRQIMTPSGQATSRDLVKGRLVGILFFTESERSRAFMLALRDFHRQHAADFVVVCVSLAGKEMLDITRALGFYHCLRRDGGQWVERDSGLVVSTVQPLPRLIICDGTTGKKITDGGVTAVLAAPDTCFEEWRKGREGWEWWQVVYTFFIG
ncbi:hypothetical protein AGDE_08760 [Angomonas deanei]|uniref:Thioredoxin-like fold domain-containing protein n=1 Tax=Angomonas deanei TaxID=59799 RepID=A0A7G2C6I2_9TRYP|nr:hypothetical protein AGDE_08760 [Angomonas deanei]CAD2215169.1 hypothetical protein, conserved [Angomonas deanei]|eukprot:EPY32303.1 hypothetical protein AGDE_08760 [Angomonas deanei]